MYSASVTNCYVTVWLQRGWTAWLQAAIDDRVIAVAPTVLSCLNLQEVHVARGACYSF